MKRQTRITVDPIVCTGHGLCAAWLPERIRLDDWGYPIINATPIPLVASKPETVPAAPAPGPGTRPARRSGR